MSVASSRPGAGTVIKEWHPEDAAFWATSGNRVANRNLAISIPALLLAFAIWMLFSAVAVCLPIVGFTFTTDQLFWLTALPSLAGATLRIFYSFVVPLFGGRRWTALATASLLIPTVWLGVAVQDTATPYWHFVAIAILCGFGGGNFASSMSNISFFYPKAKQGYALGMNAGLGNLGVSAAQFVIPLVIAFTVFGPLAGVGQPSADGRVLFLQNAGFIWIPFILLCTFAAWFGMNDLAAMRSSFAEQALIFKRKHNWLMCWLYIGTFGSFIGFSAGFPMLIKTQFPDVNPMAYAFMGPLVGALMRSVGGWLADKVGGAKLTFWVFALMVAGVFGVLHFLPSHGAGGNFHGFLACFMALFVLTGIGNASTFRMIPVIFRTMREREAAHADAAGKAAAMRQAGIESAAVIGFSSAIGAYGGFFIPKSYGSSIALTGGPEMALYGFIVFYVSCLAVTWWWYARRGAEVPC
ncbi:nitrate/nitrite transporter NarK [Rhodanobacter sp. FW510-R12]|uniref:NarK family nitrate/nitrite MFS transporter n=1 Tax=unclassified Rhodanobacter TaxID=2621553 RepID=UPI0007A9E00F|nr:MULTISPECIES: NarK family nitrate/nitrite MFS transporter [unclassified Rhodanobacter]KZC16207.1 nitrate/nitrite transporter NarK [Rhodanobacter sp. FW104-R8]KZC28335.1 nitrate/nitrite transporter NarK [Rhodanobacter sp. FW510-T8]KZC32710.1 nitrate/nitrite transporter NarK [Rhodanobacter sp. FW510-R10]